MTQMDQQINDPGLNIIIQRGDLDWQPALQNGKKICTSQLSKSQLDSEL